MFFLYVIIQNMDVKIINAFLTAGLNAFQSMFSIEAVNNEPYLLKLGFIARTTRGRVVLPDAYRHLDYPVPVTVQQERLEV